MSQTDCSIRAGEWKGPGTIPLPNCPGADVVGKIYSIDRQASYKNGLHVGDRVSALTKYGGNSRYLAIDADQLVRVPERTDPAEAVCFAETYMTAFQALHFGQSAGTRYRNNSLKGKSILLLGAVTTTLGVAISQLGALASVETMYAPAKSKNYQKLRSSGILPLSEDPIDWFERLLEKIDLIIAIDEEITPLHYKLLTSTGEIVVITKGSADLSLDEQDVFDRRTSAFCSRKVSQSKSRTHTYNVFSQWEENHARCRRDLEHMFRLLEERQVVPNVIERIPLNKVSRAQDILQTKNVPGFIVCEPWLVSKSRAVML